MPVQQRGQHYKRSAVADFISPDNGVRGRMARNGHKPKDHMSDNKAIIKNVQYKNREDRERSAQPQREAYKLSQFKDVEARVFDEPTKQSELAGKHNGAYIAKGSSSSRQEKLQLEARQKRLEIENMLNDARDSKQPSSPRKSSVPKADQVAALAPRSRADFISQNKTNADRLQPPSRREDKGPSKHESYGRVPDYLERRNAQQKQAEDNRRRNAPDPSCPPGMTLMPEDERVETVRTLEQSLEEVNRQLQKLPFVIETHSIQKRHDALESKLKEIERALTIFRRPKVYVAL